MPQNPLSFGVNQDIFFRPWKIQKQVSKTVKGRIDTCPKWAAKVEENKDFLTRIFATIDAKSSVTSSLPLSLYSTTYLVNVKACECMWPPSPLPESTDDSGSAGGSVGITPSKKLMDKLIPSADDWNRVTDLACWVWEQRFLTSEFAVELGGFLCNDILEVLCCVP